MILRELVQKIDKDIPLCVMKSPSGEIMFRRESVSDIIKDDLLDSDHFPMLGTFITIHMDKEKTHD